MLSLFGLASVVLHSSPARADEGEPADAASCPAVFGGPDAHTANRLRRERLVELIEIGDGELVLMQTGDWSEPTPIRFSGVDLIEAHPTDQAATIALDLEGVCQGTYRVPRDGEIGPNTKILAVVEDAVVVDHEGALRILSAGNEPVHLEAVWRSPWTMSVRAAPRTGITPPRKGR